MKQLLRAALALSTAGAIACSDSATGPASQKTLMSATEALTVASGIMSEVSKAFSATGSRRNVGAVANVASMPTETINSNCTNGGKITGTMTYTDNINPTTGVGTYSGSMTVTPQGCKVSNGSRLIAVGGEWKFDITMAFGPQAQLTEWTWRGTGRFTWDGGDCAIDYTMKLAGNGQSSYSGTFCGVSLTSTR